MMRSRLPTTVHMLTETIGLSSAPHVTRRPPGASAATAWSKRRKTFFKAFSEDRVEYRLRVKFREALVVIGKRLGTELA
jgi:hypothetical protein